MIVDSSALMAILREEPDASRYATALARAETCRISAATWLETAIANDPRNPMNARRFEAVVREAGLRLEPVTVEQAAIARAAYRDFGKDSGHRARLNFGDCFAYALAVSTGEPLLFKGDDFVHTDLRSALDPDAT